MGMYEGPGSIEPESLYDAHLNRRLTELEATFKEHRKRTDATITKQKKKIKALKRALKKEVKHALR